MPYTSPTQPLQQPVSSEAGEEATQLFQPTQPPTVAATPNAAVPPLGSPTAPSQDQATQAYSPLAQPPAVPLSAESVATAANGEIPADEEATQVFQPVTNPPARLAGTEGPAQPLPPAISPFEQFEDEDDADSGDGNGRGQHNGGADKKDTRKIAITAGIVVAVVALIGGGLFLWRSNSSKVSQAAALTECKVVAKQYDAAKKKLESAVTQGQSTSQAAKGKVADSTTIDTLNAAVEKGQNPADTASCDSNLSADQLKQQVKDMQGNVDTVTDQTDAINSAIKAVTASQKTADIETKKNNLSSAVSQAQATLNGSAGSVADENTRTALQTAITTANNVMNSSNPSDADIDNAISALQKAESDVNASMQAKQKADAEAKAKADEEAKKQAEEEAQQQQQQQQQQNGNDQSSEGDQSE